MSRNYDRLSGCLLRLWREVELGDNCSFDFVFVSWRKVHVGIDRKNPVRERWSSIYYFRHQWTLKKPLEKVSRSLQWIDSSCCVFGLA
jgi:hypothetical protein